MTRIVTDLPDKTRIRFLRNKVTKWFEKNGRKYPWRGISDPFRILIAEMMLQRTKADQVKPVYLHFFSIFKSVHEVANSSNEKLEGLLFPLGLKWRIKKFKEVSEVLKNNFKGKVPEDRENMIKLPGVGDYIAGIVLSTAFNKKEWIVDSNVVRVYRKYFGINTSKEGRRDRTIINISKEYASCRNPCKANLGLIDFASIICNPRKPLCSMCPLIKKPLEDIIETARGCLSKFELKKSINNIYSKTNKKGDFP